MKNCAQQNFLNKYKVVINFKNYTMKIEKMDTVIARISTKRQFKSWYKNNDEFTKTILCKAKNKTMLKPSEVRNI